VVVITEGVVNVVLEPPVEMTSPEEQVVIVVITTSVMVLVF
jgi:hypothetical protein